MFILDPCLQDGYKSQSGNHTLTFDSFLVSLCMHASTICLILNPWTDFVTPQFYVVFDELLSMVANTASTDRNDLVLPQLWQFQTCRFISDEDSAPHLHADFLAQDEQLNCQKGERNNSI